MLLIVETSWQPRGKARALIDDKHPDEQMTSVWNTPAHLHSTMHVALEVP